MILFLDDMKSRHDEFDRVRDPTQEVHHCWTAAQAIKALNTMKFSQVFLDHDLSEDDIMSVVGTKTKALTGMTVVDHILAELDDPPRDIIVHSCNGPARDEMVQRLKADKKIKRVRGIAFPELIRLIKLSR